MKKTVIVIGGAGFLGSHVVDRLRSLERRVLIVDDLSSCWLEEDGETPRFVPPGVRVIRRAWSGIDEVEAVVHCGCRHPIERERALVRKSWSEFVVEFVGELYASMDFRQCRRFVVASTLDVYRAEGRRTALGGLVGALRQHLRYWHRPPAMGIHFVHLPELVGPRQLPEVTPVLDGRLEAFSPPFSMVGCVREAAGVLVDVALGKARKALDVPVFAPTVDAGAEACPAEAAYELKRSWHDAAEEAVAWYREEGCAE